MIGQRREIPSAGGYGLTLDVYVPQVSAEIDESPRRRAVVIFPGGGYEFASEREGEPIALQFAAAGLNAFVVYYRVRPNRFPIPLQDAGAAVAYVRAHADELYTDPDKIAVMGFSAGGHLAGSLATRWQADEYWRDMGLCPAQVRPNAAVLCYPVISGGKWAHRGSFDALTGSKNPALHGAYSLEGWVTPNCPPTFLWHTWDDQAVPVANSLLMAQALAENGVQAELHLFPHGEHGGSLFADPTAGTKNPTMKDPYNAQWIGQAIRFLQREM